MIQQKTKCKMCGEEVLYMDIRSKPATCGRRICETNYEYQKRHMDPRDGYIPDAEDINKW